MPVKKPRSKKMSNDNIELLLDHGLDIEGRCVWLGNAIKDENSESGIDHNLVERFARSMSILNKINNLPITAMLYSVGGVETAGMAIFDYIKASKSPVNIICVGEVMSMGVVVLQAAKTRIMMPNAVLMTHVGDVSHVGHKINVKKWLAFSEKYDGIMDDILLTRMQETNPNLTQVQYDEMNAFDSIFTAQEAIDLGFADRLFDPKIDKI